MQAGAGKDLRGRILGLRGRVVASRALEDLQSGLAAGAGAALLLAALRWLDLVAIAPGLAVAAGATIALSFPLAGLLLRRLSDHRVAAMVDERLGLAERVATALALEKGSLSPTPLAPLVSEDAVRSLERAPRDALRRAFLPRARWRHLGVAGAALALAVAGFRAEPLRAEPETKPKDLAAAYKQQKEKEEAAKAARRVMEEARKVEEDATAKQQASLRALAAEIRRQSEEMLRQNPRPEKAMAGFQKMGEVARERMEMLAGVDAAKLGEWKAEGKLSQMDPALAKLLEKLAGSDLKGLNDELRSLDRALKGEGNEGEWSSEALADLKAQIDALREALEKGGGTLAGRPGLQKGLQVLGNPELLKKISERLGKLMETLAKQGFKSCQNKNGLSGDPGEDFDTGEPLTLSDEQLQAFLDKLAELQEMADLGQLAFCQNCGLTGGT